MKFLATIFFYFATLVSYSQTPQAELEKSEQKYKKLDKQLNLVYKTKISKLTNEQKRALKALQIEWIKYKESHCDIEASDSGASSHSKQLIYTECLADETSKRITFLKNYKP